MATGKEIQYVIPLSAQKPAIITLVPADPGSRYKTKQLQVQTVGKSKMIKSVFTNILEVAKSMQVPPSYIVHFMGYEIGAQAKFDAKKPERQQAFLSGEHDTKDLSRICVQFIQEVLLCPVCGLPELLIYVEDKKVMGNCRACGSQSPLPITNEKFKRHILNHPPTASSTFGGNKTGAKKEVATRKSKKGKNTNDEEEPETAESAQGTQNSDDEEEVVWFSDTSAEAARKRREEMLPDGVNVFKDQSTTTKITWQDVKQIIVDTPADKVIEALQTCKEANKFSDEFFVELLFKAIYVSVETDADFKEVTKQRKGLLSKFLDSSATQIAFLQTFEQFAGQDKKILPKAAFLIKDLYDTDVIEEENILEWYSKQNNESVGAVRENVALLIKWLKEAEEDSDEDDEDEE
mmetsp:Transcript_19813/g.27670  ORF Transcript_19813/g.27670 Transcript_19813/m.27670 type:complete len:406 (+) Transcript_19813:242-1459(+)|eukprot:CAMPEP_0168564634 /NCGR_PEP_ID=MMETSP0413-20121227/13359_1 /TAXON_ID=136452 /ORGANISM="Filamoeba nolandi, Strain NC-AS-23-1" /LENGTH=405 /DNA_ID=CAMNT_0008596337 /DNA_START=234 /DNA_END=1451 /DNA_ORIENTATION=+